MKKLNNKELKQKNMEKFYTSMYAKKCLKIDPIFLDTDIHPDCLFKTNDMTYAIEATGYFYQQETDYSNRLYKKILKVIKSDTFLHDIYKTVGKRPLINIVDAIYYDNYLELIDDLIKEIDIIDEIKINDDHFYNNDNISYNALINNAFYKCDISDFLKKVNNKKQEFRVLVTLKKRYVIPIKLVLIYDEKVVYHQKRTLVPIISFMINNNYNFRSLRSLIENKENKLKNIYIKELKRQNIDYSKFILLIHPLDYPIDIFPQLIYSELKDCFKKMKFDEIVIILRDKIMIINKYSYMIF